MFLLLAIEPEYDTRSDALWQATSSSLQSNAVRRNIDTSSNAIQHYAFLTGRDNSGAIGIAYLSTPCFRAPVGKVISFTLGINITNIVTHCRKVFLY